MAKAPANQQSVPDPNENLELTSINDRLVELPDESVITVDVSDNPDLAAAADGDGSEPAAVETKKAPDQQQVSDGADETLTALRKQIEDNNRTSQERIRQAEQNAENERQARLRSEQAAQERERTSNEETSQREIALLAQSIETTSGQLESLETELARLNEAGEFKEAAKVQGKIARTAAALDRLETEKATFEANIGQRRPATHEGAVTAPRTADPTPTTASGRLEAWLATVDPPAAKWIRDHPECAPPNCGGSQSGYDKMLAGHHLARGKGVEVNSPEYFSIIEEQTGYKKAEPAPGEQRNNNQQQRQPGTRKPIASAPPSHDAPGGPTPGRTRQVRLSKEQQEAALLSFPHLKPQEALASYARNLVELEAEGKIGRTSH